MNQSADPQPEQVTPSTRDRLKPAELLGFSGVLAIFAGVVVLISSRQIVLTLVFMLIAFILSLVIVALLGLGAKPSKEDDEARKDLQQKPGEDWH